MEYFDSTDGYFALSIVQKTITIVQERSQSFEHLLTSKDVKKEDEKLAELMVWLNNQVVVKRVVWGGAFAYTKP